MTAISVVMPTSLDSSRAALKPAKTGPDNDHAVLMYRDDWQVALLPDRD
jgi:hypothetical protein